MHFNLPKSHKLQSEEQQGSKEGKHNSNPPPSYASSSSEAKAPPISRNSSLSLLRKQGDNSSTKKPAKAKNVPYRPSAEQQSYIDRLGSPSSSSSGKDTSNVTALSAVSSTAHTEYFDVLPSFQMFQSILKRDDNQFEENLSVAPPEYGDTRNSSPTPPDLSPVNSGRNSNNIDGILNPPADPPYSDSQEYDEEQNYGFQEDERNDGLLPRRTPLHHQNNISNSHETYGHTVLDNIDKLSRLNSAPIDIQIFVTKQVPVPNSSNDLETRLKEYSTGDLINGYIIITNTSNEPIPFGLFTVSLEGTIKATERKSNPDDYDYGNNKFSKILMKKFLKMYDLNASYGYSHVPNSAGIEYEAFTFDSYDDSFLGLPNERILQPHVKYKKYFTFKFPNKLLDTTCSSGLLPHTLSPPSMGIDKSSFYGKADNIELNKALGYGFLSHRGTPVLTRDYSFDDMSVNYSIEAKFIDKLGNDKRDPFHYDDINDENADKKNYVISKSSQYFVRFVPDLKDQLEYYNEEFLFGKETFGTIGIDGKLFKSYLYLNTWKEFNRLNSMVEEEIDSRLSKKEFNDDEIKNKNLIIDNYNNTNNRSEVISGKEDYHSVNYDTRNNKIYYREKRMICNKFPVAIFGKRRKKLLSSMVTIGQLELYVRVPSQPITYNSPKLVMKYNIAESQKNETNELLPVNSITNNHVNKLYNRDDDDFSHDIDVSLVFQSNDASVKPPAIESIDVNLVSWSFRSDYPIPCKLEYDLFYDSPHEIKSGTSDVDITKNNLQSIKDQVSNYIHFLKTNNTYVSKDAFLYLKSIKSLGVKRDTINDYFQPINASSNPDAFDDNWKINQTTSGIEWTKDMKLPLKVVNKNNVNLIPSFQSCLVGRLYCLQVIVKYKGGGSSDQNEFGNNAVKTDVPILVG